MHEGVLSNWSARDHELGLEFAPRLTFSSDGAVRVKHFQQQNFIWLLIANVAPLVLIVVICIEVGALELAPDMIALHEICFGNRVWIAEGQWVVLDNVFEWPPDTKLQQLGISFSGSLQATGSGSGLPYLTMRTLPCKSCGASSGRCNMIR